MNKAEVEQFAEVLAKTLAPALAKELTPMLWRILEIRANDLDLLITELDKIKDGFIIIARDYCLRLTEKQIQQAFEDYQAMLKRQRNFNPGVDRRLL